MVDLATRRHLGVDIGEEGAISVSDDARKWLGEYASGTWRVVPQPGQLLIFERSSDSIRALGNGERQVELAGMFDMIGKLSAVLNLIHLTSRDGVLRIASGPFQAALFFRRGVYLSGSSNQAHHRLGEILVGNGFLSAKQRDACVAQLTGSQRLGSLLVARGMLTTPKVYEGLRLQAESIFQAVFRLQQGTFHLVAPLDMTEVPAMLRLDVQLLLLDAMRRMDEDDSSGQVVSSTADEELRRIRPVSKDDLPDDGIVLIISTYNEALRRLFSVVEEHVRAFLLRELGRFLGEEGVHGVLFQGVQVRKDGTLPANALMANMDSIRGKDPYAALQLALSELLFFLMFAAGDALDPDLERVLQGNVARAMSSLPKGA